MSAFAETVEPNIVELIITIGAANGLGFCPVQSAKVSISFWWMTQIMGLFFHMYVCLYFIKAYAHWRNVSWQDPKQQGSSLDKVRQWLTWKSKKAWKHNFSGRIWVQKDNDHQKNPLGWHVEEPYRALPMSCPCITRLFIDYCCLPKHVQYTLFSDQNTVKFYQLFKLYMNLFNK